MQRLHPNWRIHNLEENEDSGVPLVGNLEKVKFCLKETEIDEFQLSTLTQEIKDQQKLST